MTEPIECSEMHCDLQLEDHFYGAPGCSFMVSSRKFGEGWGEVVEVVSKKDYDYGAWVDYGQHTYSGMAVLIPGVDLLIFSTDNMLNVGTLDAEVDAINSGSEVLNRLIALASEVDGKGTDWCPAFFDACTGMYHLEDNAGSLMRACDGNAPDEAN